MCLKLERERATELHENHSKNTTGIFQMYLNTNPKCVFKVQTKQEEEINCN